MNTSPGAMLIETLDRAGAFTDLARGQPTAVTGGTKAGFGPTSEFAATNYWETSVIGSSITVDLGAEQSGIFAILFESHPRGDSTHIPAYAGSSAYVLQYSSDNFATPGTNVPPVAPAQGDIFIHRFATPVSFQQLRIVNNGPATVPNPVRIAMIRILAHAPGDATRIDSRRLYGGQIPCRPGFLAVSDGRICMEATLRAAATIHDAIGACKALAPGCRVCTHNDFQQACGSGVGNPYGGAQPGWFGDHGTEPSTGNGDDEYLSWNVTSCVDNSDGPSRHGTETLPYRCCY